MICEYGCGQEARFYFKTVNKWCCSEHYTQCPAKRKENSMRRKEEWEDPNSGLNSTSWKKKQSKAQKGKEKLTIKKIQQKYKTFSDEEEMRYNPDKPGEKEIQVHCKNHLCLNSKEKGGWFIPTRRQLFERITAIEKPKGFGESNFYCLQECKDICPIYNRRSDPFKNTKKPFTPQEQRDWKQKVLTREEYICEWCEGVAIIAHHVLPVKTHPLLALDPDNGVACCKDCHIKYGHKTGTECSTGSLANKVLLGCKLGGQE